MNDEKIVKKLLEHDKQFEQINTNMVTFKDEMNTRFDQILVIVQRLDQERLFTFEIVKRMQKDLEAQQKDMKRVKQILKIA